LLGNSLLHRSCVAATSSTAHIGKSKGNRSSHLEPRGKFLKIEVKAKQTPTWGHIKGLSAADAFLVFVDFADRDHAQRPDFFILSAADWRAVAMNKLKEYRRNHPDRKTYLDADNCLVFPEERNKYGNPFRGCDVRIAAIEAHREAWQKIVDACARITKS
jgi:hypothetical protein